MKKNRPGILMSVLCQPADADRLESILFCETTTLGVRRTSVTRSKLPREPYSVNTPWGLIDGVLATLPDGQPRFSPEYESCRQVAEQQRVPLRSF